MDATMNLNLDETVARAKREVIADVLAGRVPATVRSFAGLHDYVDANYYGGAFEQPFDDSDEACEFWNNVQEAVHVWMKAGALAGHGR